jgi:ABC-type Fe3+/spermidine/putrescine transport system ATPase subunit
MAMTQIILKNICKSFDKKPILENIHLQIQEGELVTLLGPSGCGKTTTLKVITGLLEPDEGEIYFNGASVLNIPVEKRGAVIVFQDYLLFPHMTVIDNVAFGLKVSGVSKKSRNEKAKKMIQLVQLKGYENRYPRELSGGEKQRVAIARALAVEPKVLLLDEPFSNLDTNLRESTRDFVINLQKELKITTMLVTHDQEEALLLSDKIAVMLEGKIKQFGTPMEIYKNPISQEVADFFGEKNYFKGTIKEGFFHCSLGSFSTVSELRGEVKAMIHPERIQLYPKEKQGIIKGRIQSAKYGGHRIYYILLLDGIKIKAAADADLIFKAGEEVSVNIDFNQGIFYK